MCVQTLFRKCRSCEMITIVDRARVQHALEPADGVDVEVVGRLVEQQDVRIGEQRLRQQHAQLAARRDVAHRPLVQMRGDLDAEQQFAGARLGRVAVELGDLALPVRRRAGSRPRSRPDRRRSRRAPASCSTAARAPSARRRARGGLRRRTGPGASLPSRSPLSSATLPRGRLEVAAQDLHERRLAAAVGADQAVAIAVAELDRDVLEQGLGAELHRDVGRGEQENSVRS